MNEPTLHEVVRRLDDVAQQITNLVTKIDTDRRRDAETYVRRDVYAADRRADASELREIRTDIKAVEDARKEDLNWRRNVSLALAVTVLASLTSIGIALINYVSR